MPDDATDRPERHLTLPDFARECGAHPNTVRQLVRKKKVPYTVEDLVTGALLPPEAQRPKRFRYLFPERAVQHVANLVQHPVKSHSELPTGVEVAGTSEGSHPPPEVVTQLRGEVARLEAENTLLREHNTFLQDLTDRLLPMLPAGPNAPSQAESPVPIAPAPGPGSARRPSWWARIFRGNKGEGGNA